MRRLVRRLLALVSVACWGTISQAVTHLRFASELEDDSTLEELESDHSHVKLSSHHNESVLEELESEDDLEQGGNATLDSRWSLEKRAGGTLGQNPSPRGPEGQAISREWLTALKQCVRQALEKGGAIESLSEDSSSTSKLVWSDGGEKSDQWTINGAKCNKDTNKFDVGNLNDMLNSEKDIQDAQNYKKIQAHFWGRHFLTAVARACTQPALASHDLVPQSVLALWVCSLW